MKDVFLNMGEYALAGMYEEPERSLFYRKALGLRRYYENCILPPYTGKLLYPSGVVTQDMTAVPEYLNGISINYNALAAQNETAAKTVVSQFCKYHSTVPLAHTVAGNMYTHSMPHYERVLKEGLLSYIDRIAKIADADYREGLLHLVRGIERYVLRIIAYLQAQNADPKLIAALQKVPLYPAETIYEAVVCWNFILYLDNCDNLGCVASGLYPYYKGENIVPLLENLYDNLDSNGGYSMALHTDHNELTLQCLEASKGKRRPMIELFVDENTSEAVWEKAFEVVRTTNGQPAFYNPHVLLEGLQKKIPAIRDADIRRFCGGGCTESMIAGLSCVGSLDAGINLALILEQVLDNNLVHADSFEQFYDGYIAEVRKVVLHVAEEIRNSQIQRAKYNPLPMRSLLIDDCIDSGKEYNAGGARYKWSIVNFAGLINVIDSMLAIRDFVFINRTYTAEAFLENLRADDNAPFLNVLREHPNCFGRDITQVNTFSHRLSHDILTILDGQRPAIGECFLPASIQFMSQVMAGAQIGATPDGRAAHAPLCDSLAAIFGKDRNGPTALLNSVAALDQSNLLGVPVLNFNINPGFRNEILKALILGYFKSGGIQIQLSCVSAALLQEAYENPDLHKNLIVRVGGYSEHFYRLSDELKRMIIDRTIQNEV